MVQALDVKADRQNRAGGVLLPLLCLLVLSLIVIGFRANEGVRRVFLFQDDAIAYLASTASEGPYAEAVSEIDGISIGTGAEWLAFTEAETPAPGWKDVSRDLTQNDIHPPLYYFLLAQWRAGLDGSAGGHWLLNGSMAALLLWGIWFAGRGVVPTGPLLAAAALAATSPVLIGPYWTNARHYELLAVATLFALGFARRLHPRDGDPKGGLQNLGLVVGLSVAIAIGFLSAYQFVLFLASIVIASLLLKNRLRLGGLLVASITGGAIALALHPDIFEQFSRAGEVVSSREFGTQQRFDKAVRDIIVATGIGALFRPPGFQLAVVAFPAAFALACVVCLRIVLAGFRSPKAAYEREFLILSATGFIAAQLILYVGGFSPWHSFGGRYFLTLIPFAGLLLVTACRHRFAGLGVALWAGASMLYCLSWHVSYEEEFARDRLAASAVSEADDVLVLNTARGLFPGIIPFLRPDSRVIVLSPDVPASEMEAAVAGLSAGAVLVLEAGYAISEQDVADVLDAVDSRYDAEKVGSLLTVYQLQEKTKL